MTIDQALEAAKQYVDESILPKRSTLYGWIKTGAISGPIKRENKGKAGGLKDIYDAVLPCEIAVVAYLQKVENLPIKTIAEARGMAESLRTNTFQGRIYDWNTPRVVDNVKNLKEFHRNIWFAYLAKTKAGFKIEEPAQVTVTIQYRFYHREYSVQESVEKAPEDSLTIQYDEDRTDF